MDEDARIEYGFDPNAAALFDKLMVAIGLFGKQQLASWIGICRNSLTKIPDIGCQILSPRISQKIVSAITALEVGNSPNWAVGIWLAIAGRCVQPTQSHGWQKE
jgi:hypothetical protein